MTNPPEVGLTQCAEQYCSLGFVCFFLLAPACASTNGPRVQDRGEVVRRPPATATSSPHAETEVSDQTDELAPSWGRGTHWKAGPISSPAKEPLFQAQLSIDPKSEPLWEFSIFGFEEKTVCVRHVMESFFDDFGRSSVMYATGPPMSEETKRAVGNLLNTGTFPGECPVGTVHCPQALLTLSLPENFKRPGDRSAISSYSGHPETGRFVNWFKNVVESGCDPNQLL